MRAREQPVEDGWACATEGAAPQKPVTSSHVGGEPDHERETPHVIENDPTMANPVEQENVAVEKQLVPKE